MRLCRTEEDMWHSVERKRNAYTILNGTPEYNDSEDQGVYINWRIMLELILMK
jgi:hypothetical protein